MQNDKYGKLILELVLCAPVAKDLFANKVKFVNFAILFNDMLVHIFERGYDKTQFMHMRKILYQHTLVHLPSRRKYKLHII